MYSPLRKAFTPGLWPGKLSTVALMLILTGGIVAVEAGCSQLQGGRGAAVAQQVSPELRQYFLSDPLTTEPRDLLLPVIPVQRSLSPLERSALAERLDQLNQIAQQRLAAGQQAEAFEIWQREVRLRRALGPAEELAAIARVATLAWNAQQPVTVQLLTLRTREIWDAVKAELGVATEEFATPPVETSAPARTLVSGGADADIAALSVIAQTFVTLRDIDSATDVYRQLIAITDAEGNDPTAQQIALAELHLQWFQFAEAADVYLALLQTARDGGQQAEETVYLERLVYSYQQAESLANAVRAQTDLIELYQAQGEAEALPELLLAIAQNYRTLNLPRSAVEYYRAAYSAAQRFEQFSFSARVLQDLGALYTTLALTDDALGAYTLLIPVAQQAYDDYTVMNAYDKIGQLQRRQGNQLEALKAFERALVIATRLSLREDYFVEQIRSVT